MDIYTLTFESGGQWLAQARSHDRRFELVRVALEAISAAGEQSLVVLPAGALRVGTPTGRDRMAEQVAGLSRQNQLGVIFTVDVSSDDTWAPLSKPAETFLYSCNLGQHGLWGDPISPSGVTGRGHSLALGDMRFGVLVGREVFHIPARKSLARLPLDLAIILSHGPITSRWKPALASLDRWLPTLIVANEPAPDCTPRGWCRALVGRSEELTMVRYRRLPGAQSFASVERTQPLVA